MSDRETLQALTFRRELLERVMPLLRAGESCSLVGASGVGKSNLVRFIQRPDVQAHYWGDAPTWVIAVDTHSLVFGEQPDEFVVSELLMHRLIREAERRQLPGELLRELDEKYAYLMRHPGAHLALRYLERVCGRLVEQHGVQLVFLFDQFEDVWKRCDARLFLNLRYLRDEFKYHLGYLVITRERLTQARQRAKGDTAEVEAFWELFTAHSYGLGMYNPDDATGMIAQMAQRRDVAVPQELQQLMLERSGRHPALLRAIFWEWCRAPEQSFDAADLLARLPVVEECAKLWHDLTPEEQHGVRALAAGRMAHEVDEATLTDLRLKELVQGQPPALFAPLFGAYALSQSNERMAGLVVMPHVRQVWLDGQPLTKALSPLEFNLLEYLAQHAGQVCKREAILQALYNEQVYDTNDERLDTLLRRLRETLGDDARKPRFLITHRGVGVQLLHGRLKL